MLKLNNNQEKILKILRENFGNPLTIKNLSEYTGISSTGVVHHHLVQLEKRGWLKRNPDNPRDFIIFDEPERAVVHLNMYGTAKCGPGGRILTSNPIDQIPVSTAFLRFQASEAFIVQASGKSMEPKINEGDLIIAQKKSSATHGDIVVCVYKSEVLIKQFTVFNNEYYLSSLNQNQLVFPPRRIQDGDEFQVEGVVRNIIKYY